MPKDSLKSLLKMFSYFFDKREISNFYRSQYVTNERFKDIYQSSFDVYESFHLNKRLLVWKEQSEPYVYTMHFVSTFQDMKQVKIYKNNQLIYTEEYSFDEHNSFFEYSYNYDTRNDIEVINDENDELDIEVIHDLIPQDEFIITVETYDEYIISKGFPENDDQLGNIFDHDVSLDELGAQNNIPRKTYVVTEDYDNTEPTWNDRLSEDDYHYMKRIIEYNLRLHNTPAPILELWKLYGVEANMLNRERLLLKMFDATKHPHHYNDDGEIVVDEWQPKAWEHKDKFCDEKNLLGEFFFVSADTVQPVKKQPVYFTFEFMNSLADILADDDYVVDIYLNGIFIENCVDLRWKCDASLLDEFGENIFTFVGMRKDNVIDTIEIAITVRGCNTADIYVNPASTKNVEDGSKENPFKTLEAGIAAVTGVKNLIAIFGEINTEGNIPIKENCTILGCNNAKIINTKNSVFFKVPQNVKITTQDITYVTDHFTGVTDTMIWTNENPKILTELAIAYNLNYAILINDLMAEKFVKNLQFNQDTGILSWTEYDLSEIKKLSDLAGVVTNLRVEGTDVWFTESEIIGKTIDELEGHWVYFENRKELVNMDHSLTFNSNTGKLSFIEIPESEIVYDAKLHNIMGAD